MMLTGPSSFMIRFLDISLSLLGLVILAPVFVLIAIRIKIDSRGTVFFRQIRVGKNGKDFKLFKFRTMRLDADRGGLLTVGGRDSRITPVGYYLRKYKIDELPQLWNVLVGEMSLVGPRPEVRKYVNFYTEDQRKILEVRPGITDLASIKYKYENEILSKSGDAEHTYISQIMPDKIKLNMDYINNPGVLKYFQIIVKTFYNRP